MTIRNICIYGAGALGGAFAAKIASGLGDQAEVSVVARGAHLDTIRRNGLTVRYAGEPEPITARVTATDTPSELPPQDLVITGLKGHQLAGAAEGIAGLLKDGTRVVMILNGIPWWYFHRDEASGHAERQLEELDPGGRLWRLIGPERVIGCVAYQGAEVVRPGEIGLSLRGHFFLGEPSGVLSDDLRTIADLLRAADLDVRTTQAIREVIWEKLMRNAAVNPTSALTRALCNDMVADPDMLALMGRLMEEVQAVGKALGVRFAQSVEQEIERTRTLGAVRTSMLQDLLAGKPLEIMPLTGMIVSLGKLAGIPVPASETILTLAGQLDRENLRR